MTTDNQLSGDVRAIHETIDFGFQVQAFLESPIGKYLAQRAEDEVEVAVEQLKSVEPTDVLAITRLQNDIKRAESFGYWLAEALQAGLNAQRELIEQST